ncbi:DUF1646 family protein [Candidatus Clostridium radicumherbarum]|uniref:DUF1646 family protein n=1 Tax=Candidatus Clostridium radicumherbarum TaxID=3381662 RepID=A0ABW8TUT9_9CLOT
MITVLIIILILTFILPLTFKTIEHNIEFFLFIMGIGAAASSGIISKQLILHILENNFLYAITATVFVIGFLFKALAYKLENMINKVIKLIPLRLFVFLLVFILGLLSSVITAMVAALILVEIIILLPIDRKSKVNLNIIACFSIGLGAALTPIGEPVATIVISKLNADFFYLFKELSLYVVIGIILLSILAAFSIKNNNNFSPTEIEKITQDTNIDIAFRAIKIFIFVIALELLGSGFKPIIDTYVIGLDSKILYWGNTISAILDNATLASAEISPQMNAEQIKAIMLGLLLSGGMLIPGNIPNIISAGKLKIKSSEWIKLGVPLGLFMLSGFYVILFII